MARRSRGPERGGESLRVAERYSRDTVMALSAFTDNAHPPTGDDLVEALGRAHRAWVRLIEAVTEDLEPIRQEWGFTSASTGWGLRLVAGKRVIVYLTPNRGYFRVSFALGERGVKAAETQGLPPSVLEAIAAAPRYAEGRGVRFEVRQLRQVPALARLARIKFEH